MNSPKRCKFWYGDIVKYRDKTLKVLRPRMNHNHPEELSRCAVTGEICYFFEQHPGCCYTEGDLTLVKRQFKSRIDATAITNILDI